MEEKVISERHIPEQMTFDHFQVTVLRSSEILNRCFESAVLRAQLTGSLRSGEWGPVSDIWIPLPIPVHPPFLTAACVAAILKKQEEQTETEERDEAESVREC